MVPRLQWLLLLWGLPGLWAQDYEDDYEDGGVNTRRRTKQLSSNVIPRNGKCKSKALSLSLFCFPLLLLHGKVVWVQLGHHHKMLPQVKVKTVIPNKDKDAAHLGRISWISPSHPSPV